MGAARAVAQARACLVRGQCGVRPAPRTSGNVSEDAALVRRDRHRPTCRSRSPPAHLRTAGGPLARGRWGRHCQAGEHIHDSDRARLGRARPRQARWAVRAPCGPSPQAGPPGPCGRASAPLPGSSATRCLCPCFVRQAASSSFRIHADLTRAAPAPLGREVRGLHTSGSRWTRRLLPTHRARNFPVPVSRTHRRTDFPS